MHSGEHLVRLYQDREDLAASAAQFVAAGVRAGEAVVVIATPEHRAAILRTIEAGDGQLRVLGAGETLAAFMADGMPQWNAFHALIGGLIAELRLQYPAVRAYGEMVDVLWQRGERDAAIRLEEYWNELGSLQTFSLFCAYHMDPLDPGSYGGPLESVCGAHTRLIPHRDAARFDAAVREATRAVLAPPFAELLLELSSTHRAATQMPTGQATLLWLGQNMPRAAAAVLSEARARLSAAPG